MKNRKIKWFVCLCVSLLVLPCWTVSALWGNQEDPLDLYAQAAILMDADTGEILYEKNAYQRMEPASLTKIMTCMLAIEEGNPQELVTMTADGLKMMEDASSIDLVEGERLTMEQMLYALMLPSANDAANAIAIHLAGSMENFAEKMNQKAAELGLSGSNFVNPSGLPEEGHYSTAYDLAEITRAALSEPEFFTYAGASEYEIPKTRWNEEHTFSHLNRTLLKENKSYDPRAIAGKTGWTDTAGNCLMTVGEQDGVRLISILLKSDGVSGAVYQDNKALFDYGFSNFKKMELALPAYQEEVSLKNQEGQLEQYLVSQPEGQTFQVLLPTDWAETGAALEILPPDPETVVEQGMVPTQVQLVDGQTKEVLTLVGEIFLQTQELEPPPQETQQVTSSSAQDWMRYVLWVLVGLIILVLFCLLRVLRRYFW